MRANLMERIDNAFEITRKECAKQGCFLPPEHTLWAEYSKMSFALRIFTVAYEQSGKTVTEDGTGKGE